ncbi:hypothetical protein ACFE04_000220 [Oxalis oulophora]
MDSLLYLVLSISIFLIFKLFISQYSHHKNLPPSPPSLPFLGHFLHFIKSPPHISLNNLSIKHGPILFLKLGSRRALLLSDISAIEECFTKNDSLFSSRPLFQSRRLLDYNFTILGAAPYGSYWRNLRKFTVLEIFSQKCVKVSSRIWDEEIKFIIQSLPDKKIDVNFMLYALTYNTMMRMVAGSRYIDKELDCDESPRKFEYLKKIFDPSMDMAVGDFFPLIRWSPFCKGVEKNLANVYLQRDKFMQGLIDSRRNATMSSMADNDEMNRAIIDVVLSLQESEPETYTDDYIKGVILVLMIGGTETTSITISYAVSQLLSNPEILNKARKEIDTSLNSKLIEDDDLSKLPYLHCIINEALRLGPVVSTSPARESSEDCTVGGYYVPSGTMLLVNAWAVHRDPKLWGEDADVFKPERFEDSEGTKSGIKFLTFGAGRRQCPGIYMSIRLMALTIGTLIQCFNWEENCECEQELKSTKKMPFNVVFRPRPQFAIS